jgi:hypothetical protein
MKQSDAAWWARARQARDQLAQQLLQHPDVSLIDIGLDPQDASEMPVLRVHVRGTTVAGPTVPDNVDGIPVRVILGDYKPQR